MSAEAWDTAWRSGATAPERLILLAFAPATKRGAWACSERDWSRDGAERVAEDFRDY